MKGNPTFRLRVMQSSYFRPEGHESLSEVIHSFGDPLNVNAVYKHMERHQSGDLLSAAKRYKSIEPEQDKLVTTAAAVEGEVMSIAAHERGLDAFIEKGREKLDRGEMNITASNYLEAIKVKANIEKSTKDRRMEMIKNFFNNGPKEAQQP